MSDTKVTYRVVLEWDDDGKAWNVTVPALPGCFTFGKTRAEALERAKEAIAGHLMALREVGEQMPQGPGEASVETVQVAVSP